MSHKWNRRKLVANARRQRDVRHRVNEIQTIISNAVQHPAIKFMSTVGSDLIESVAPFYEKPSFMNGVRLGFGILKTVSNRLEIWPHDYFTGTDEWVEPFTSDFSSIIVDTLSNCPYEYVETSSDSYKVKITTVNGHKVGWLINLGEPSSVNSIYVKVTDLDETVEEIKRLLWGRFNDKSIVMMSSRGSVFKDSSETVKFCVDDSIKSMHSKRAVDYSKHLKNCLNAGLSRSIMLYGPPGTGKSTLATTIVSNLGLRSLRIRVTDLSMMSHSTIAEAINVFEPNVIILDDFDRASQQEKLLETLEYFQEHVKLVIATVNDRRDLDEALLRPGRFDELTLIDRMDDDVIHMMLGDQHSDMFDIVKDWPIAFINEYVKRCSLMSKEEAAASVKELAERVNRLHSYESRSEVDRVIGTKFVEDE